jgi:hypothetical protein
MFSGDARMDTSLTHLQHYRQASICKGWCTDVTDVTDVWTGAVCMGIEVVTPSDLQLQQEASSWQLHDTDRSSSSSSSGQCAEYKMSSRMTSLTCLHWNNSGEEVW